MHFCVVRCICACLCCFWHVCHACKGLYVFIVNKLTHAFQLFFGGSHVGAVGRGGERMVKEFGLDMYTLQCLKWITNKDLLYSTGNSAQCYVAAWMGGEFGEGRIHVYV